MQSHNGLLNNGITSLDFTNPFAEPNNPPTDKTAAAFFAYLAKNQDKLIFDKGVDVITLVDTLILHRNF